MDAVIAPSAAWDERPRPRDDRAPRAFVWSVWLVMVLACWISLILYTRDIPLTEDWLLVRMLTGNESNLLQSLWEQNNEHRVPLPTLILLGILEITGGDFRVGMALNILLLSAAAAALVHVARVIRGGVTKYADALFPAGLLHLGHWENLFWSWQLTMVIPVVLLLAILCLVIRTPELSTRRAAASAAVIAVALPLCGGIGLLLAPFWAAWVGYCGARQTRQKKHGQAGMAPTLLSSAAVTVLLVGVYFVGYERPSWVPPNPGLAASVIAAAHFVALGWGPGARNSWILSTAAAMLLLLPALVLVMRAPLRTQGRERHRALGFLVFALGLTSLVLATGWGRAGVVAVDRTWPIRYVLFAFPVYVAAFFAWELYGGPRARRIAQNAIAGLVLLMVPLNSQHGLWWRDWYLGEADKVTARLQAGASAADVAQEHISFLNHTTDPGVLEDLMLMLKAADIGPWSQLRDDPATATGPATATTPTPDGWVAQEVRYQRAGSAEVVLVWGLGGWATVPEERRPAGTYLQNNVMYSPMAKSNEIFVDTISVPSGATIHYGFLTTRDATGATTIWDGDYVTVAGPRGTIVERIVAPEADAAGTAPQVESPALVDREFRYRLPGAGEVVLIWGIEGWRSVPAALDRNEGTVLENGLMNTPMRRDGDGFTVTVPVPSGANVDYGFLVTDLTGLLDMVRPVWDPRESFRQGAIDTRVIDVSSSLTLPNEVTDALARWRRWAAGLVLLLGVWVVLHLVLSKTMRARSA